TTASGTPGGERKTKAMPRILGVRTERQLRAGNESCAWKRSSRNSANTERNPNPQVPLNQKRKNPKVLITKRKARVLTRSRKAGKTVMDASGFTTENHRTGDAGMEFWSFPKTPRNPASSRRNTSSPESEQHISMVNRRWLCS